MRRRYWLIATLCLWVLTIPSIASIDRTQPPLSTKAPQLELASAEELILENGLHVFIIKNDKLPRAYVSIAIDNPPYRQKKKRGIKTLTSAMLGNGTQQMTKEALYEEIDFMGAQLSITAGGGYGASLSRFFPRLLELFAESLLQPVFTEDEFSKQKTLLLESIRSEEKSVQAVAGKVSKKVLYGSKHAFGEIITAENIQRLSLKDIKSYYHRYTAPNNAYMVIVGDVNVDEIKANIVRLFSPWSNKMLPFYKQNKPKKNAKVSIALVDMPNAVQTEILIGHAMTFLPSSPDYIPLLCANAILGGSSTSRLFMNLREDKGFTYGAYSSVSPSRYMARFTASTSVRPEVVGPAITEMLEEIKRLRQTPVTALELTAVKEKLIGQFIMSTEKPSTVATFELNKQKYNLPDTFYKDYIKRIESVTVADIQRVVQRYIQPDRLQLIIVGNASEIRSDLNALQIPINDYTKEAKRIR